MSYNLLYKKLIIYISAEGHSRGKFIHENNQLKFPGLLRKISRIELLIINYNAGIAQLVEQRIRNA